MQHFAASARAGHLDETRRSIEADGFVAERSKIGQVAAGTTAEVEQHERRRAFDRAQERSIVLGNVMVARSLLKRLRRCVIMGERSFGKRFKLQGGKWLAHGFIAAQSIIGVESRGGLPSLPGRTMAHFIQRLVA